MKLLLLLLFLSLLGNKASENRIAYRPLTWSDFKRVAPTVNDMIAARSYHEWELEDTEEEGAHTFRAAIYFLADSSFVRYPSDKTLQHEQTHFRLFYIECIKLNQQYKAAVYKGKTRVQSAKQLFEEAVRRSNVINEKFDRQTQHGLEENWELIWELKTCNQLKQLEDGRDEENP